MPQLPKTAAGIGIVRFAAIVRQNLFLQLVLPVDLATTPAVPATIPAVPVTTPAVPMIIPAVLVTTPAVPVTIPAVPVTTPAVPAITPAVPVAPEAPPAIQPAAPAAPAADSITIPENQILQFTVPQLIVLPTVPASLRLPIMTEP